MIAEIGLLLLGIAVIILELFIPAFGLIGSVGAAGIIIAIVRAYKISTLAGTLFLLSAVITVPGIIILFFRIFPSTFMGRRLILRRQFDKEEGFSSYDSDTDEKLVGSKGLATSDLRPAGSAEFGEKKLSVVTSGEYIEKGSPLVIKTVAGSRIVVEKE